MKVYNYKGARVSIQHSVKARTTWKFKKQRRKHIYMQEVTRIAP